MPKKDFAGDPGGLIGDAIFTAIKPIYKEAKRQERAARSPRRSYYKPIPRTPQKYIVFGALPRAIENAGANFSRRDLYYAVRPLVYAHYNWDSDKTLGYNYFSQQLLTEYQEDKGPIEGLWTDPRGNFHEPHTGKSIGLGTREVLSYEFPEYTFDKILYVEKEGEWPSLRPPGSPSATTWRWHRPRATRSRPCASCSAAPRAATTSSSASTTPTSTATTS